MRQFDEHHSDTNEVRELWRAWQGMGRDRDTGSPVTDADRDEFVAVLSAVARGERRQTHMQGIRDFVATNRQRMLDKLADSCESSRSASCVRLYRGVYDSAAIAIRRDLSNNCPHKLVIDHPLSYTIREGVARGFARRGHIPGLAYFADVRWDEVLFHDAFDFSLPGHDTECEVMVMHNQPVSVPLSHILRCHATRTVDAWAINPHPSLSSRDAKRIWDDETAEFLACEPQVPQVPNTEEGT